MYLFFPFKSQIVSSYRAQLSVETDDKGTHTPVEKVHS